MTKLIVVDRAGREHVLEAAAGLSVMEAIRHHGLDELLALCGGCCSCATCHVYVDEAHRDRFPARGEDEDDLLESASHRKPASRLSCQLVVADWGDSVRVTVAPED
jgi:2Fe-2S ferredoxin